MGNCCKKNNNEDAKIDIVIEGRKKNKNTHYTVNYPLHDKRKKSKTYVATRIELIDRLDIGCFICGKCKSEYNSIELETHHFYIEKVATNAIDWKKFGEFSKNCYNIQTGENINKFNWEEVEKNPDIFVDSKYNMIVLCKMHHRQKKGIHSIPYPDWILQKFAKGGFEFIL
jgi:hypothetical protein